MRLDGRPAELNKFDENDLVIFDRWILSRLERTIETVNKAFDEYRLAGASKTLYNFVWDDYCSWYIELIKPDQPGVSIRKTSLDVATYVLDKILKLMHPFVPFVTEEIYQQLIGDTEATITFGPWLENEKHYRDDALEDSLKQIQEVVTAVRGMRVELNVPPGKKADLHIRVREESHAELLQNHAEYFRSLARVENLTAGTTVKKPPFSASAVIAGAEIYLPLSGLIDIDVEKGRLQKNLNELKVQLEKLSKKMGNADFLANAPKDVIDKEKTKREDYEERIERLNRNLEQIMGW